MMFLGIFTRPREYKMQLRQLQKECKLSDHQVQGVPSKNEVGILLFKSGTSGALDNINGDEKRKSREQ